jgi:purine-nucleoside phosphorylase
VLVVTGSGLDALAGELGGSEAIGFDEVPGFPSTGVHGHAGRYVHGSVSGRSVLIQSGRFHYYEGHSGDTVVAPIRIAAILGVQVAILTNASGGVRPDLTPGTIVVLADHLNVQSRNPLREWTLAGELRLADLRRAYDPGLIELAQKAAGDLGLLLPRGCYAAVLGPTYETRAEVRMLAKLGADLVGMSTVPEVIAARAGGLAVLGLSVVTDRATEHGSGVLTHDSVLEVARKGAVRLAELVRAVVTRLSLRPSS